MCNIIYEALAGRLFESYFAFDEAFIAYATPGDLAGEVKILKCNFETIFFYSKINRACIDEKRNFGVIAISNVEISGHLRFFR